MYVLKKTPIPVLLSTMRAGVCLYVFFINLLYKNIKYIYKVKYTKNTHLYIKTYIGGKNDSREEKKC